MPQVNELPWLPLSLFFLMFFMSYMISVNFIILKKKFFNISLNFYFFNYMI